MSADAFPTVTAEGGLLPGDTLARVAALDKSLPGLRPDDYHLDSAEELREAISRAWNRLTAAWHRFRAELDRLPGDGRATTVTRERFLLPLFQELGYGRLPATGRALTVSGRDYAISHLYGPVPIHLLGARVSLEDKTERIAGAAKASPHGLVQDFLNRSDDHLWGVLSNGLALRMLRDHHSLTQLAYVEFDLEAMFEGSRFSDFALLWLVCHQSRVEQTVPEECLLERWFAISRDEGVRALDDLRSGVERAISALGTGFLRHPENAGLRQALAEGTLSAQDYYRQLLRLVYRLIFLFAAEDRGLLLDPDAPDAADTAKDRYRRFYATRRLRDLAGRLRGGPHGDLWQALMVVMGCLGEGAPPLALPALGSFLWSDAALPDLRGAALANEDLLAAVRHLSYLDRDHHRYPVAWRAVAADELGSIYESLLELHPLLHTDSGRFELETAAGNERKMTGSYYTPSSLVACLLDTALDPVLDEATRGRSRAEAERALLDLKVCDPACGSGHFLVGAARRMASRLARVRTGDDEPSPRELRHALRDVVGRCIYGVDINPMSVELCKVALWMEALEPGKPLSFLDHHIQQGNALFGATPALVSRGIPDDAFKALAGDDKAVVKVLRKRNRAARKSGQESLFADAGQRAAAEAELADAVKGALAEEDADLASVRARAKKWEEITGSRTFRNEWFVANAWCAAFVWPKQEGELAKVAPTHDVFLRLARDPDAASRRQRRMVNDLAREHGAFHWHLAFPDVFTPREGPYEEDDVTGWNGGFDVVLGNPPWDEIQFEDIAWFAQRNDEVSDSANAADRRAQVEALREADSALHGAYMAAQRAVDGSKLFIRSSGRFPNSAHRKLNTYALFAEHNARALAEAGRMGCIVPTGIATDAGTQQLFSWLMSSGRLHSLYDFSNRRHLFPAVRPHQHFCLLTVTGGKYRIEDGTFAAGLESHDELKIRERQYRLSWAEIQLLSPTEGALPLFRSEEEAAIFRNLATRFTALGEQTESTHGWKFSYKQGTFNTASASDLFRPHPPGKQVSPSETTEGQYVPLFDAKMARQYEWRAASVYLSGNRFRKLASRKTEEADLRDPSFVPTPAYWVPRPQAEARLGDWTADWVLGFKDVTGVTSTLLSAFAIAPRWGIPDKFPILRTTGNAAQHAAALGWLNSLLVEFFLRQRMHGVSLTWHLLRQVPIPTWQALCHAAEWDTDKSVAEWISPRVAELTVTSWLLTGFLRSLQMPELPFQYRPDRRDLLRAEVEAAWFCLAGLSQTDVALVMDSLDKVRRRDDRSYGEYRTRRLVLDIYDRLGHAIRTGQPYQTVLDPPPADRRVAHGSPIVPGWAEPPAITVPDLPGRAPGVRPELQPALLIYALVQARGGAIPRMELTRALALLNNPEILLASAPEAITEQARAWSELAPNRQTPPAQRLLKDLARRGGLRLTTDSKSQAIVEATPSTPAEDKIDPWFQFEARLSLAVLESIARADIESLDAKLPEADRPIREAIDA